jgi:hypothetical protein
MEWGAGVDYLWRGLFLLGQINQVALFESAPGLLISDPSTQLTALVRRGFLRERLEAEMRAVYTIERGSWILFPRLSYLIWDDLRVRAGYLAVGGPSNSLIGQFHDNSEIVLQARYSF